MQLHANGLQPTFYRWVYTRVYTSARVYMCPDRLSASFAPFLHELWTRIQAVARPTSAGNELVLHCSTWGYGVYLPVPLGRRTRFKPFTLPRREVSLSD